MFSDEEDTLELAGLEDLEEEEEEEKEDEEDTEDAEDTEDDESDESGYTTEMEEDGEQEEEEATFASPPREPKNKSRKIPPPPPHTPKRGGVSDSANTCNECNLEIKPGQPRYRTMKAHKWCGEARKSMLSTLSAKKVKIFREMKKKNKKYHGFMQRLTSGAQDLAAIRRRRLMARNEVGGWRVKKTARERKIVTLMNKKKYIKHMLAEHTDWDLARAKQQWKADLRSSKVFSKVENGEQVVGVNEATQMHLDKEFSKSKNIKLTKK